MNLGTRLKELREARGISIYRLSRLTDVSENHIHSIEHSEKQPTIYTLEKLLDALQVSLSEFFYEGGDAICPTDYEKELLYHVRQLNPEKSAAMLQLAKLLYEEYAILKQKQLSQKDT